jgi:hypothetical protein
VFRIGMLLRAAPVLAPGSTFNVEPQVRGREWEG